MTFVTANQEVPKPCTSTPCQSLLAKHPLLHKGLQVTFFKPKECDILTFGRARKIRRGKIDESASHLVGPYVLFSYPEKIRGLSRKTTEEIDFEKKNLAKILI